MDDIDDAEEANEEDLLELGDEFAQVKLLVAHLQETIGTFIASDVECNQYIYYCARQLPKSDTDLARRFLKFAKETPPL